MSVELKSIAGDLYANDSIVATGNPSFKNKLINGDFGIWQRSVLTGSTTAYYADRWRLATIATMSIAKTNDGISLEKVSGTGYGFTAQYLESTKHFSGKVMTLSLRARTLTGVGKLGLSFLATSHKDNTANLSNLVDIVLDETLIIQTTSVWDTYTMTVTLPTYVNDEFTMGIFFDLGDSAVGVGASKVEVTNVQLEEGSVATPFEVRPIGVELAVCQRYYQEHEIYRRFSKTDTITIQSAELHFPEMRTVPSTAFTNVTGMNNSGAADTARTLSNINVTKNSLKNVTLNTASYGWIADLALDAEL